MMLDSEVELGVVVSGEKSRQINCNKPRLDYANGGKNWENGLGYGWVGRPRVKGRYLPLEILWDPIVKLRNWGYSGFYDFPSDTEKARDRISREGGKFGYNFFVFTVGCHIWQVNHSWGNHILHGYGGSAPTWEAEGQYRHMTRMIQPHTANVPSVWLGTCPVPAIKKHIAHFGVRQAAPGQFRFNVVHLDGHVHDSVWSETATSTLWHISGRPYGWKWQSDKNYGVKENPDFNGAYDKNR